MLGSLPAGLKRVTRRSLCWAQRVGARQRIKQNSIALIPKVSLQSISAHAQELGGQRLSVGECRGITAASAQLAGGTVCLRHWVSSKTSGLITGWFGTLLGQPPDLPLIPYARGRLPAEKPFGLLDPSPKAGGDMLLHYAVAFWLRLLVVTLPTVHSPFSPAVQRLPLHGSPGRLTPLHSSPPSPPHSVFRVYKEQPDFQSNLSLNNQMLFAAFNRGRSAVSFLGAFLPLPVEVRHKYVPLCTFCLPFTKSYPNTV